MKYIADTSVKGLKKKIQPSGNVWVLIAKQRIVNKTITITYGKVASISLTEARNRAKQDLALLSQGINPRDKQHELAQTGKTLSDAIQEYLTVRNIKPSTIESYRGTLTRNFSDWFEKPLRAISEEMVLARYKRIQKDVAERAIQKKKANPPGEAEAQKAIRTLTAIFNSFKDDRLPSGERLLPLGNPCEVLTRKGVRKSIKRRETYLNADQREILRDKLSEAWFEDWNGQPTKQQCIYILLLLLTGARKNELRLLKWSEVNFDEGVITFLDPKNKKKHYLPITRKIESLLKQLRGGSSYVFYSMYDPNKPESMSKVIQHVTKLTGIEFTFHDLRRTTATILSEHGYQLDDIARLLNHSKRSQTDEYVQTTLLAIRPLIEKVGEELFTFQEQISDNIKVKELNLPFLGKKRIFSFDHKQTDSDIKNALNLDRRQKIIKHNIEKMWQT